MKKGFVRALWGEVNDDRREKVSRDIERVINCKYRHDFTVYCFGKDNHRLCSDMGLHSVMINDSPVAWDLDSEFWRHKLDIFNFASQDFDDFVYLDWDCFPVSRVINPWPELEKKEVIQANLFQYRTKKCLWRELDHRKVCNGGFVYIRGKFASDKMIKIWDRFRIELDKIKRKRGVRGLKPRARERCLVNDDEPTISKYVDELVGGWPGEDKYYELFEPEICNLRRNSVFPKELNDRKNIYFFHKL